MTYSDLAECILLMPPDLRDCQVAVLEHQDEIFGIELCYPAWVVNKQDVVDTHSPVLVLNGVFNEQEMVDIEARSRIALNMYLGVGHGGHVKEPSDNTLELERIVLNEIADDNERAVNPLKDDESDGEHVVVEDRQDASI